MPLTCVAMDYLKTPRERCRRNKYEYVFIIHGYGSAGKGGAIHEKARQWLKSQKQNRKVKLVILGEDFSILNYKSLE